MNKKIIELAEKADFCLWGDESWAPGDVIDWGARYDDELENFAKLIIKECCSIALQSSHREDDMGAIIARNIEKHFKDE